MRRPRKGEKVERFRTGVAKHDAAPLKERIQRWASAVDLQLEDPLDELPCLSYRQQDICDPLIAIARVAGPDWPARTVSALTTLFAGSVADETSHPLMLLEDIREIFHRRGGSSIASIALAAELVAMEGRPWADLERGRPITPNSIARLLRPFHVSPRTVRIGTSTPKGYAWADFGDVWSRYSEDPGTSGATTPQAAQVLAGPPVCERNPELGDVGSEHVFNPHESSSVAAVAAKSPGGAIPDSFRPATGRADFSTVVDDTEWL
jgi:hypothetical protein